MDTEATETPSALQATSFLLEGQRTNPRPSTGRQPLHTRTLRDTLAALPVLLGACTLIYIAVPHPVVRTTTIPSPDPQDASLPASPLPLAGAPTDGSDHAAIGLMIYSDFQCPFCKRFARETLPAIEDTYVHTGKVLLVFRNLPLTTLHPLAFDAATYGVCAAQAGRFWQFHDLMFAHPGELSTGDLAQSARRAGLDLASLPLCLAHAGARVESDVASATLNDVRSTPTLFLGLITPTRSLAVTSRFTGAASFDRIRAAIDSILQAPAQITDPQLAVDSAERGGTRPPHIEAPNDPIRAFAISAPLPTYPPSAIRRQITGVVVATLTIDDRGHVADATILTTPSQAIGAVVAQTVRLWRFRAHIAAAMGRSGSANIVATVTFYFINIAGHYTVANPHDAPEVRGHLG